MSASICCDKNLKFENRQDTYMHEISEVSSLTSNPRKRKYSELGDYIQPSKEINDTNLTTNTSNNDQYMTNDDNNSTPGIKRFRGDNDDDLTASISSSGYESDSEEETFIHKPKRKRRKVQINEEVSQKRMRYEQKRQEQNYEKSVQSKISDHPNQYSADDCSDITSTVSKMHTSTSSASDSSSGSGSSSLSSASSDDSSCSSSSDDSSMDSVSSSSSDSLGLSLSDTTTTTSEDDSQANDIDSLCHKRLMPKIIKCPKSCVCKIGCSSPPAPIARRGGVSIPLYKRVLTCRMLSEENVSKYDCCDHSCYVYWIHRIKKYSLK